MKASAVSWPAGGGVPPLPLADRWCLAPALRPPPSPPPPPPPPRPAFGEVPGYEGGVGVYRAWGGTAFYTGRGRGGLGAHRRLAHHPPTAATGGPARRLFWRCTASVTDRGPRSDCDCESSGGRVPRRMRWCQGGSDGASASRSLLEMKKGEAHCSRSPKNPALHRVPNRPLRPRRAGVCVDNYHAIMIVIIISK